MSIFILLFLYIGITISFIQNWLLITLLMVGLFSFRYGAVALIPLAIIIDGYFGHFFVIPYLSISAVTWYIIVGFIQPKLINLKV